LIYCPGKYASRVSSSRNAGAEINNNPRERTHNWRILGGVAVAALALLVGLTWEWSVQQRSAGRQSRITSILVLPLENLSRDPQQEYFSDGMTDALIADLSRIRSVRVISRTSAMHYKQRTKTLPEIAQELNVDAVVEGSVMRFGNRVRITAELIEARQDRHLWADTYERDLDDILKLQKELAEAIARQVRVQLNLPQQARLASVSGVDPKAYEAFAKGRFYLTTNSNTPQGIKQALSYFEHAVQKDSDFALAYVGLADCYQFLGGFRRMPPRDAYQRAKEAIDKALLLDATLARPTLPWAR
jgi:adenylate cyclase